MASTLSPVTAQRITRRTAITGTSPAGRTFRAEMTRTAHTESAYFRITEAADLDTDTLPYVEPLLWLGDTLATLRRYLGEDLDASTANMRQRATGRVA